MTSKAVLCIACSFLLARGIRLVMVKSDVTALGVLVPLLIRQYESETLRELARGYTITGCGSRMW